MDIYIYGNSGFKKEIHETLEHANIKFKLDENSKIVDLEKLEELKEAIFNNPDNIFLIDDEKIIKKNSLSQKIKFLTPKDGIEHEFLLDNGIADVSVDSLADIPKYILKKHDEYLAAQEDIQNSIIDIVDEAYDQEVNLELDDELSKLLATNDFEKKVEAKESASEIDFSKDEDEDFSKLESLLEDNKDENSEEINETLDELDSMLDNMDEENNVELNVNLDDIDSLMDNLDDPNDDEDDINLDSSQLENLMNFEEDVGLNNTSLDYDDKKSIQNELNTLDDLDLGEEENKLAQLDELDNLDDLNLDLEEAAKEENTDEIAPEENDAKDELDALLNGQFEDVPETFEPEVSLNKNLEVKEEVVDNSFFEEEILENVSENNNIINNDVKGASMSDQFSELDSLNEKDILDALGQIDNSPATTASTTEIVNNKSLEIDSSNVNPNDLSALLSKLLNNKTLEITIKIKD